MRRATGLFLRRNLKPEKLPPRGVELRIEADQRRMKMLFGYAPNSSERFAKFGFADDRAKGERHDNAGVIVALSLNQILQFCQPFPRQLYYMVCNIRMDGSG